jgi:hypothetical protein
MFETFPSSDKSLGQWNGSARDYLSYEDALTRPAVNIVNVNSNNTGINTDYRRIRFGIATTLLGEGYFSYDYGTENHAQTWRFDEYDIYLGAAKGNPERKDALGSSITQGVWERDYSNGKVLLNATGQAQTIRLDGEYEKLHGSQDPAVNDGRFVSRVTIGAQDGLILLRPLEAINNTTFVNGAFARIFAKDGTTKRTGFFAYDPIARGSTRIVHADTDADGVKETVVADDTYVSIYDNGQLFVKFAPYTDTYKQGVNIAVADLEKDGTVEIVTGTERGGGPQLRIFNKNGVLIHPGFFAYDTTFRGGVNVALGDLNGDGTVEVVAGAGVGGGPHVRVFNKDGKLINPGFFAYDPKFRGGVNVAVADIDGDGKDEIITGPGKGGGPHVRVFDKDGKMKAQFFAFEEAQSNGLEVAATDLDGDGRAEIIGLSSDVFTLSTR